MTRLAPSIVPGRALKRFYAYHRVVEDLVSEGADHVSSAHLADVLGIKATQVRKDFTYIGMQGRSGRGYSVADLDRELSRVLGLGRVWRTAVVGLTPLGRALLTYPPLLASGYRLVAAFDRAIRRGRASLHGVPLYPMDDLSRVVQVESIEVCLLCADESDTAARAQALADAGVGCILSFGPSHGVVHPDGATVFRTLDLVEQLNVLTHRLRPAGRRRR